MRSYTLNYITSIIIKLNKSLKEKFKIFSIFYMYLEFKKDVEIYKFIPFYYVKYLLKYKE